MSEEQFAWLETDEVVESQEEVAEEPVVEDEVKPKKRSSRKTKELVTVRKVRGPRITRAEGDYVTGKEYEVAPEVAEILLGLTSPHGQSYFESK